MLPEAREYASRRAAILRRITAASVRGDAAGCLLAVSKMQPAGAIRALAAAGQTRFGENYVQEAVAKQAQLDGLELEWHLIGPLQSNKCALAAGHFDWVHTIDRSKLIPLLARARDPARPLNVLVQVNIDDEASKSGCQPAEVGALAAAIAARQELRLRGLMAIPSPTPDPADRLPAFRRMHALFVELQRDHPGADTLSMGMSDDFELALGSGATLVRVGTALFGARR